LISQSRIRRLRIGQTPSAASLAGSVASKEGLMKNSRYATFNEHIGLNVGDSGPNDKRLR